MKELPGLKDRAYIKYVLEHYDPDRNLLIDSSGLPNGIHMPLTGTNQVYCFSLSLTSACYSSSL
ncbi:MAG: hypothetical protein LUF35_08025 [Lachnospiraceae bacterium]|nr:hypothetical protein [Lachnospiraceae bacterium]